MKNLFLLAAVGSLAACQQSEPAPEPAPTEDVSAVALAADGAPTPGQYRVTRADGTVVLEEVRDDGTYSTTVDGEVTETGRWEQKDAATYCYTSDAEGSSQICNTEVVDEDGVWRSTNPDGETSVVERVDS